MNIKPSEIQLGSEPNTFLIPTRAKQKVYDQGVKAGRFTLNQVRAHQGLPPVPYGDNLFTTQAPKGMTH